MVELTSMTSIPQITESPQMTLSAVDPSAPQIILSRHSVITNQTATTEATENTENSLVLLGVLDEPGGWFVLQPRSSNSFQ